MYANHQEFSAVADGLFPFTATDPYNSIDSRHRHFIYELIMAGRFWNILEIGTWIGYSSAAIVKAAMDGAARQVTLCDFRFQPSIHELAKACPDRVKLIERPSVEVISSAYDFIFVDGDHSWRTLAQEIHLLLRHRVPNVLFHDTNTINLGIPNCEGPWLAKILLSQLPERYSAYYLDETKRPGERTERGLMLFSNLPRDLVDPIWQHCMK